jgi:RNA ligase (TIGR02306 family)
MLLVLGMNYKIKADKIKVAGDQYTMSNIFSNKTPFTHFVEMSVDNIDNNGISSLATPTIIVRETSPLASIQRLYFSGPVPQRDNLVTAKVLGFTIVANKSHFTDCHLCVFFEPDAILDPDNDQFAYFDKISKNKDKQPQRIVKRQKMYGILSEGLVLPVNIVESYGCQISDLFEGQDVTGMLHVTKYISAEEKQIYTPSSSPSSSFTPFPSEIVPKTDETNVQSKYGRAVKGKELGARNIGDTVKVDFVKAIVGRRLTITTKLDGTSMTVTSSGLVCGRNYAWNPQDQEGRAHWEMAAKYDILNKIAGTFLNLQGEICGPRIQNNRLGLSENHWFIFNIFNSSTNRFLSHKEVVDTCARLNLETVPCVEMDIAYQDWPNQTLESLLSYADAMRNPNGSPAEGIVVKTADVDDDDNNLARFSFKVLSRNYGK